MSDYFSIKNWEQFQHYKDRDPPWIKLHVRLLDDYEFGCLQDASKLHLILLWVLASRLQNKIPLDERWLQRKLNLLEKIDLKTLEEKGFIICYRDASNALAKCSPETEAYREEADKEKYKKEKTPTANFEEWYGRYPHKVGKGAAVKAYDKARRLAHHHELMGGLENYLATKPADRPWCNPATWLNQQRWKDQPNEITQRNHPITKTERANSAIQEFIDEKRRELEQIDSDRGAGQAELRYLADLRQGAGAAEEPDEDVRQNPGELPLG